MKHGFDLGSAIGPHPGLRRNWRGQNVFEIITRLGLAANLQLCLDAGEADSYTSGQSWLDLSGNGYDFFLGADGSATATDPTFTGTAGQLSSDEYWAFDGGDYFTYDSANEAWMNAIHQDNATYTLLFVHYMAATGIAHRLCGTLAGNTVNTGFQFNISTGNVLTLTVASGTADLSASAGSLGTGWHVSAVAVGEANGAGGSFLFDNGSLLSTFDGAYAAPSAGAATYTLQLAALGNGVGPAQSGDRMAIVCMWSRRLFLSEVRTFHNAIRGRFSI